MNTLNQPMAQPVRLGGGGPGQAPNLNSLLDHAIENMHMILERAVIIERATLGLPPQQLEKASQAQEVPSSLIQRLNILTSLQNTAIHTLGRVSEAL